MNTLFEQAKAKYAKFGVDVECALETLKTIPVSIHCWQGDDVAVYSSRSTLPLSAPRIA